jgi:hypothetical protein
MYVDNQHVAATPGELLSPFHGLLAPGLTDEPALRRLLADAAGLPDVWHWAMLETRLGADAPELDLLACVSEREDGRRALGEALTAQPSALAPLRAVLGAWSEARDRLAAVPLIWIEWDRGDLRSPLIWLGVDPGFFAGAAAAAPVGWISAVVGDAEVLAGAAALSAALTATLARCAEALPEDGRILGAASLRPRGRELLRLFVRLPRSGAVDWLTRIGWSGDRALAAWWIRQMTPAFMPAFVQIEVDEQVRPYLAVEAPQTVDRFPERWHREGLLRSFIAAGLATADKVDTLLSWPGIARLPDNDGSAAHELCRSFHLKLVIDPAGPCEVKAYLGAQRRVARDHASSRAM